MSGLLKEKSIKKKIAKVIWVDAHCHTDSSLANAIKDSCTEKEIIGCVLVDNKDRITLCWDYDTDGGGSENSGIYSIPRAMVKEIIELVEKKK